MKRRLNIIKQLLLLLNIPQPIASVYTSEVKRPSLIQQELQKQQIEAMMSTSPSSTAEVKAEGEGEPAVAKFQLSNVGLKVVVSITFWIELFRTLFK